MKVMRLFFVAVAAFAAPAYAVAADQAPSPVIKSNAVTTTVTWTLLVSKTGNDGGFAHIDRFSDLDSCAAAGQAVKEAFGVNVMVVCIRVPYKGAGVSSNKE